jgi:hypothetical protein
VSQSNWSDGEKKIARRVFERALRDELAQVIAEFKSRAAAVVEPDDMWPLEEYLREARLAIDRKYDYRYSQLLMVFAHLLREGRIQESDLTGFSQDKLRDIQRMAGR